MPREVLPWPASGQALTRPSSSLGTARQLLGEEEGRTLRWEVGILFSYQNEPRCSGAQTASQTSLKVTFAFVKSVPWGKGETSSLLHGEL